MSSNDHQPNKPLSLTELPDITVSSYKLPYPSSCRIIVDDVLSSVTLTEWGFMVSPKNFWGIEITVPVSCNCLVYAVLNGNLVFLSWVSELYDIIAFELVGTPLI